MTTGLPEELMERLRQRFIDRSRLDLALIEEYQSAPDADKADHLEQQVHNIAGIAALFGYDTAGHAAALVNGAASIWPLEGEVAGQLEALRIALQELCDEAESG